MCSCWSSLALAHSALLLVRVMRSCQVWHNDCCPARFAPTQIILRRASIRGLDEERSGSPAAVSGRIILIVATLHCVRCVEALNLSDVSNRMRHQFASALVELLSRLLLRRVHGCAGHADDGLARMSGMQ